MTVYGPWIQPDDQDASTAAFPNLTEVNPTFSGTYYPFWPISPFVPGSPWISSHADSSQPNAYMMAVELPNDDETGTWFPAITGNIDHYEAETDNGEVLGLDASFILATNGTDGGATLVSATGTLRRLNPSNYTLELRGGVGPYFPFPLGGPFGGGADSGEVGAWAEILHTTTGYYDADVGPFDSWNGFTDVDDADTGPDGRRRVVFGLLVDEYASGAWVSMDPAAYRNMLLQRGTITYRWRPPRYRAVYDVVPPLRQFPRDDGLGVGAPGRTIPRPATFQTGPRQHIAGGYA